jgi:molybdopterin synthase catalytic subunit
VSRAHRFEAFHACHALIDDPKDAVPIWRNQRFTEDTDEWVST